jgi:hypothetical protein
MIMKINLCAADTLVQCHKDLRFQEEILKFEEPININLVPGNESGVATSFCHRTPNGCGIMDVLWDFITVWDVEKHCNTRWAESIWSAVAKSDATPLLVRKNESFEKTQIPTLDILVDMLVCGTKTGVLNLYR